VKNKMEHVAMASVCLACKIEEDPRRPRDVINVFSHIKQVRLGKPIKPVILDSEYVFEETSYQHGEESVERSRVLCPHQASSQTYRHVPPASWIGQEQQVCPNVLELYERQSENRYFCEIPTGDHCLCLYIFVCSEAGYSSSQEASMV